MIDMLFAEIRPNPKTFQPEVHFAASIPLVMYGTSTKETEGLTEAEIFEKLGREIVKKSFAMAAEKPKDILSEIRNKK
jgi:hypothetical protein